jgi:hypothetical protein
MPSVSRRKRYKLQFGPYQTPRFRYGSVVRDRARGEVRIVGLSSGRIPWPVYQCGNHKSPVLYQGLARAVKREAANAIMYWWGWVLNPSLVGARHLTYRTRTKARFASGKPTPRRRPFEALWKRLGGCRAPSSGVRRSPPASWARSSQPPPEKQ